MSLGVPLRDALREKQAPHSLCRACSLEVPATLIEPECEIDRVLLRILRRKAGGAVEAPLPRAARSNDRPLSASASGSEACPHALDRDRGGGALPLAIEDYALIGDCKDLSVDSNRTTERSPRWSCW
jgi:hypothetical protein